MLSGMFRTNPHDAAARDLYKAIVEQARRPVFYLEYGVPDSLDGRFELIVLHAFLVLRRLRQDQAQTAGFAQTLVDILFLDMDTSLRELGAGDLGVGRRVKTMAQGFHGRIAAYDEALEDDPGSALAAALGRNLYGTVTPDAGTPRAMADYMRQEAARLAAQPTAALVAGRVEFGEPPRHSARVRAGETGAEGA